MLAEVLAEHNLDPERDMGLRIGVHIGSNRTKILDFRGFDSIVILIARGEILRSLWDFQEISSQSDLGRDNLSREIGRSKVHIGSKFLVGKPLRMPCLPFGRIGEVIGGF